MNSDICDNCGSTCEACAADIICAQCALELNLEEPHECEHPDGVPVY